MENEKTEYIYLDKNLVTNLLNSDEDAIKNLEVKVTLLENLVKEDIKKYTTEREKRECIEIYSNVINELREVIYEYNLSKGINITEGIYQDSVKPKLLYENNLIRGMEYMRTMFPPLDKEALLNYLNRYTRLLCKHRKEDRYSEELWFKTKMCLRYLDGILFSSDIPNNGTDYNAMTLENYLEFMLNEDLTKDDPSRYVRYLKRYKPKYEQKPIRRVEPLFDNRPPRPQPHIPPLEPMARPHRDFDFGPRRPPMPHRDRMGQRPFEDRYERDKPIMPPPENLSRSTSNALTVIFIIVAIIVIILLVNII